MKSRVIPSTRHCQSYFNHYIDNSRKQHTINVGIDKLHIQCVQLMCAGKVTLAPYQQLKFVSYYSNGDIPFYFQFNSRRLISIQITQIKMILKVEMIYILSLQSHLLGIVKTRKCIYNVNLRKQKSVCIFYVYYYFRLLCKRPGGWIDGYDTHYGGR